MEKVLNSTRKTIVIVWGDMMFKQLLELDEEKVSGFLNNNFIIKTKRQLFDSVLVTVLLSIPSSIFGANALFTTIFFILIDIFLFLNLIKVLRMKEAIICYQNLLEGINSLYLGIIFLVIVYKILVYKYDPNIWLLAFLLLLFLCCSGLFLWSIIRRIKKGAYKESKANLDLPVKAMFGGMIGYLLGKNLFKGVSQDTIVTIITVILVSLSFLSSLGVVYILKFYLQKNLEQRDSSD